MLFRSLESSFVVDPKLDWVKIDNIVIGEEKQYAYKTIKGNTRGIGGILDDCYTDNKIIVVVYDLTHNIAYTKTGFNLNVSSDYKKKSNFTSFVINSRVNPKSLPEFPTPPVNTHSNGFVVWDKPQSNFLLNNKIFNVVGPNIYWLGLTEEHTFPSHDLIESMFVVSQKMSSTVIRSHTLGYSSGSDNSLYENINNNNVWAPIDYSFVMAKKYNIKLICPLTDQYWWANGNYGDICKKHGVSKDQFWYNQDIRNDFKNYISNWLNHTNQYTGIKIKDSPELFLIELGNELGDIRQAPDGSWTTLPTKEWLSDISNYIKSIDTNHLILDGCDECLGSQKTDNFNIDSIDVYSAHFYGNDYNRLDTVAWNSSQKGKAFIIGEYSPNFDDNWFSHILGNPNIKGAVFWDLYPVGVYHDDGQTIRYGDPNDNDKLLRLTNYHRRAQGLQTLNQLL